jgi:hypothetical protein
VAGSGGDDGQRMSLVIPYRHHWDDVVLAWSFDFWQMNNAIAM